MSQPSFSSTTTAEEVAATFAKEIQGKNVLITGTSVGGIGFETAWVLAKHANLVIITGHNSKRLKIAADTLKNELPTANIRSLRVDLSSLASVRKAAAECNTYPEPLHVLINNAASPFTPFKLTADNLESSMATNHIGPFLFTLLLIPKLLAARTTRYTPRVVFVSSTAHSFVSGVNFDTLGHPDRDSYNSVDAYSQSKAANVLTAIELSKRSNGLVNAYSLCPGVIYTTIMRKADGPTELHKLGILDAEGKPNNEKFTFKTLPQGAATTMVAALNPALNDTPGAFLSDCVRVANLEVVAPHSCDAANAEKLWTMTEEIVGEKVVF
ncbi:short-chain dehydrogenase [Mycena vitilis]|nr:short-chain dehydrogenase [Mycena vitilis]